MTAPRPRQVPIAVVGIGALMPGEQGAHGFWRTVVHGRDLMTDVPATRWLAEDYYDPDPAVPDKTYARRGAFLPDVGFDPMVFGILPNSLAATDTVQLLALTVAEQVLADAGGVRETDRDRVSVILGAGVTADTHDRTDPAPGLAQGPPGERQPRGRGPGSLRQHHRSLHPVAGIDVSRNARQCHRGQGSIGMLLVKGAGHAADVEGRAVRGDPA
ncbi:acyl transferase domain-containing protein [Streptomyces luteogriseus]|uniref:beta-ketoacyl synthase N-terminal-like domain-containing protein n=1 Tax=Streptomyces luteogriseus TaxID=68233 RepID=UPI00278387CA|nr:beta-ketoacyl synthase N-terminal-like domain-containing protein [Streptomyces luteogriseus]MDQ0710758.1 acyl transferase domain-containing protein [Streptomyces luteogriseus]